MSLNKKSNSEYWAARNIAMMKKIYNSQEQKNKLLVKEYNRVLREIKSDLADLYAKMDDISLSEAHKYDRYNKFVAQIETRIAELGKKEIETDKKILKDAFMTAYETTFKDINAVIPINFDKIPIHLVEKAILYPWSGSNYSEVIWKNTGKLAYELKNTITSGLIKGEGYVKMANRLDKTMGMGQFNALRVIRTETVHITAHATLERYRKSGVERVQYIAADDERTCDLCGVKHYQIYPIDKAPDLPIHPQCRCGYAPVIDIE